MFLLQQAHRPRPVPRLPGVSLRRHGWKKPIAHRGESVRPLGVHPSEPVGKVLTSIRASKSHPTVTLHFADRSAFQIRVDGYSPTHPGVPKTIETSPELASLLAADGHAEVGHTVAKAAVVNMTDKAFERGDRNSNWDQRHAGVAFKFQHEERWHCVWAALEEFDDAGQCTFKSFNDVYLEQLATPRSQNE